MAIYIWRRSDGALIEKCATRPEPAEQVFIDKYGPAISFTRPITPYANEREGDLQAVFDASWNVTDVITPQPDYNAQVEASNNGADPTPDWTTDALVILGQPVWFRIRIQAGEKPLPNWNGKTKSLPFYTEGQRSVLYKPVYFTLNGAILEGIASWTPDKPTDYILRPVDILREYPNVFVNFVGGDARCEVYG